MLTVEQFETVSYSLLSYVVRDEDSRECVIIDPPPDIHRRMDLLNERITAVINTHTHPDHTLGNHWFRGRVPILAHTNEGSVSVRFFNAAFGLLMTGRFPSAITCSLTEGARIPLGRNALSVMHTPGHSPGSICLSWAGILISGDTVFAEGIGRTDIPGGSMAQLKKSIQRILSLPDETAIWPGHSYGSRRTATLGQVRRFLNWVVHNL